MALVSGTRAKGALKVLLYDPGYKYFAKVPGFGLKFKARDMWADGLVSSNTFDGTDLDLLLEDDTPVTALTTCEYREITEDLGGLCAKHYHSTKQTIGLSYWQTTGGKWEAVEGYHGQTMIHNRDATAGKTVSAQSTFWLPPNPYIALLLWRAEQVAEDESAARYTEISFGGKFRLILPYGGQPCRLLYLNELRHKYSDDTKQVWEEIPPEGGAAPAGFDGISKGEYAWLKIGCWGERITISLHAGGGGEDKPVAYRMPYKARSQETTEVWLDQDKTPIVPSAQLGVKHNAGQIAFAWYPIYCYHGTTPLPYTPTDSDYCTLYYRAAVDVGYPVWMQEAGYQKFADYAPDIWRQVLYEQSWTLGWSPTRYTVIDDAEFTGIQYIPADDTDGTGTRFCWKVRFQPVHWKLTSTGATRDLRHPGIDYYQSPMLYAIQWRRDPEVFPQGTAEPGQAAWPSTTDITQYVQRVEIERNEDSSISTARLRLQVPDGALRTISDNQLLRIDLGYLWDGVDGGSSPATYDDTAGYHCVFVGYVQSPGVDLAPGEYNGYELVAMDPLLRLRDEKALGMEPDAQILSPVDAVKWLAKRAGFHEDQLASVLGSSTLMALGTPGADGTMENGISGPEDDSLMPAFGTELLDSALEYCRRDNNSHLWAGPDQTTLFKLVKSNGDWLVTDGTLYEIKENAADFVAYAAPEYHLYTLDVQRTPMDPDQYADTVVVRGKTPQGRTITSIAQFLTANNGGWRHMHCIARDHLQTYAACTEYAYARLAELNQLPILATVETDVIYNIALGDRFKITNATESGRAYKAGVLSTDAAPKVFRVVGYRHTWDGPRSMPRTHLIGRSTWTS